MNFGELLLYKFKSYCGQSQKAACGSFGEPAEDKPIFRECVEIAALKTRPAML